MVIFVRDGRCQRRALQIVLACERHRGEHVAVGRPGEGVRLWVERVDAVLIKLFHILAVAKVDAQVETRLVPVQMFSVGELLRN